MGMAHKIAPAAVLAALCACPSMAQQAQRAELVRVERGVESAFFSDTSEARRELAARMACADSWTPRTTIYESIDYQVDWSEGDRAHPDKRKAIARNISVRCRL